MPRSNKPGWIDWVNSAAREIMLEDLLPDGYLFGKNDMSASLAWEHYRKMPEFKSPQLYMSSLRPVSKITEDKQTSALRYQKKRKK